jgi:sugar phosphate isomerase/epimerase
MLILTSGSFPHYGLERFFQFAKAGGFDGVEIVVNQNFDTHNQEYLKKLETEYELPIKAFSLPDKNAERYLEKFEKVVKHFPGVHLNLASPELFSHKYKTWIDKRIPRIAKAENLYFNRRNSEFKLLLGFIPLRAENSIFALRQAGYISLDLSALHSSNLDIIRSIRQSGSKLRHVYLSNVDRGQLYASLKNGVLPLESFLTKLKQQNYKGVFTLRLSPKAISEGNEERMNETLKLNREFFDKYYTNAKELGE